MYEFNGPIAIKPVEPNVPGAKGQASKIPPMKCKFCDWHLDAGTWTAMQDPMSSLRGHIRAQHQIQYVVMESYLNELREMPRTPPEVRLPRVIGWG